MNVNGIYVSYVNIYVFLQVFAAAKSWLAPGCSRKLKCTGGGLNESETRLPNTRLRYESIRDAPTKHTSQICNKSETPFN